MKEKKMTLNSLLYLVLFSVLTAFVSDTRVRVNKKIIQDEEFTSVKIGNQVWMTENLNETTFQNGDGILMVKDNKEWMQCFKTKKPAWCYYENKMENGSKYGKLYNFYAVNDPRGLAPKGWHIPSEKEYEVLVNFLGDSNTSGVKLKSNTSDWGQKAKHIGTNESGFAALPSGARDNLGKFGGLGGQCSLWTSTEYDSRHASAFLLVYYESWATSNVQPAWSGYAVRCIKD